MNKNILALLAVCLSLASFAPAAGAAEISIAPPPIAHPSYEGQRTRVDATYVGFDTIDGDGFGFAFNHKQPLDTVSGYNVTGGFFGFSIDDGTTTGTAMTLGVNYERELLKNDMIDLIGFLGPTIGYLYFETCNVFCFEFDTSLYGAQVGAQVHIGPENGMQVAPFFIAQSLSGSDVDTITTTMIGIDLLFGEWSLSGALNQSEDDDVTIISVGYRF